MRAATTILMMALLSGCSAGGELVRAQSDQREALSSSSGSALPGAPGDGSVLVIYSCREQPRQPALWRKAPLSVGWLGSTIPASSFVAGYDVFTPSEEFFLVPGGDRAIPDVVLGRDVELAGPDGHKTFEFVDEGGKRAVVMIPSTMAGEQVYRTVQCH